MFQRKHTFVKSVHPAGEEFVVDFEKTGVWERNQEIIAGRLENQGPNFSHLKSDRFDPDSLWERVDGDMELLRELLEVFTEEGPRMLASIEEAIQHGSALELQKSAHKMKGSVLQFSATAAAAIAFELEEKGKHGSLDGTAPLYARLKDEIDLLWKSLKSMVYGDQVQTRRA